MISTRTSASALLIVGLMAATTALSGCGLLPFGQTPTAPATGPAAGVPAASSPAADASATASLGATAQAAVAASLTAPGLLGDQTEVPDVTGLDAKDAQETLKQARLDYILTWSGDAMGKSRRVVSQTPPPGSTVTSGTRVTILAATGKGEGRPFPIFYYGTTADNVFGLRSSGTITTSKVPVPEGTYIVALSRMALPIEVWVIDDGGHRTRLAQTYKSKGKWYERVWALKVASDGDDRDFRDYQFYVKTSNSTWWDVRYGFFVPGAIYNVEPTADTSGDGGAVP